MAEGSSRADTRLVLDIALAASKSAAESIIIIKCDSLPAHLRLPALAIALHLLSAKSTALQRTFPELAALVRTLPLDLSAREEADLRKQAAPFL